jgi:hypothetical protein
LIFKSTRYFGKNFTEIEDTSRRYIKLITIHITHKVFRRF